MEPLRRWRNALVGMDLAQKKPVVVTTGFSEVAGA